jgi:hypothetical protein
MELIENILFDANKDITRLKAYVNNKAVRPVFEYGFDPAKKFILPEGVPPFKAQLGESIQLTGAFYMETRRFYVMCRADLKPIKREQMFIQVLERVSKKEAEILLAIKDQTLGLMYPNITFDKLKEIGMV